MKNQAQPMVLTPDTEFQDWRRVHSLSFPNLHLICIHIFTWNLEIRNLNY